MAAFGVASYAGWYTYHGLIEPKDLGEEGGIIHVEAGENLDEIAYALQQGGYIRSNVLFSTYARVRGLDGSLQAGDYHLSGSMSAREVLDKIASGDAVFNEIEVTVPEGFTVRHMAGRFESVGLFTRDAFLEAARMDSEYEDIELLREVPKGAPLDGYLFPDTYRIFADSTPESVVRRMVQRLEENLKGEMLQDIRDSERSVHEVITLASIVQKESPTDDMDLIAGVFHNRLEAGWLLESDATLNYALGTSKLQPTFADTRAEHAYNTYRNRGLPPGPIGSPGIEALEASVYPADHDYFFFLHKASEETVLSQTFSEHLAAKSKYLD